jgi:hypothetical protein
MMERPAGMNRGMSFRERPAFRLIAVALCLLWLEAGTARAVVINTLTGTGNTSAPVDDPGWANVGVLGIGTGVYLGNDWVLTAAHVGGGSIVLNGGTYAMLAGSGTTLTNNGAAGKSATTDLYMFRLTSTPAGLPNVTIASATASGGNAVTMIGSGRDRGAFTEWSVDNSTTPWTWTPVSSGGDAAGYKTIGSRSMRWGTNDVSATGVWVDDGYGDVFMLGTSFTDGGSVSKKSSHTRLKSVADSAEPIADSGCGGRRHLRRGTDHRHPLPHQARRVGHHADEPVRARHLGERGERDAGRDRYEHRVGP